MLVIIGCGVMGSALARGLKNHCKIKLLSRTHENAQKLANEIGADAPLNLSDTLTNASIIFLAVKPYQLKAVSDEIKHLIKPEQIIVSLLSGVTTSQLQESFPKAQIIRAMPNIAVEFGEGVIGLVENQNISKALKDQLNTLFSPLGLVIWLKENQIDALTALSGSGPAFILTLIEAMVEGGIAMGLSARISQELTLQTMKGAIELLKQTNQHPGAIRWNIASPGGTTIEGIRVLEQKGIRAAIIEALIATKLKAESIKNTS